MADFRMPALGADMETGRLVQWLVKPGDSVKPGDVVAVVETHKGAIDVEIFLEGTIDHLAPLNEDLRVGAVLAQVHGAGESQEPKVAPASPAIVAAPSAAIAVPPHLPPPLAASPAQGRQRASPAARQRASGLGLELAQITGTGEQGAITLADVQRAAAQAPARPASLPPAPSAAARAGFNPALMRKAIATAMARSKREIPHYYLAQSIDFTAAAHWLERWNADHPPEQRMLAAVLLLKATARALVAVPQLNGFFENDAFRPGQGIHIGWAVALRGGGLVAPAVHHTDQKTLPELMEVLRDLVQRARTGGLRSSEISDPTITVTSLGERGAEAVWGVIYPPQVAIAGFGRVVQRPWVVDDRVLPRSIIQVSLAADHRASDGHVGGQLLAAIDQALQSPETL